MGEKKSLVFFIIPKDGFEGDGYDYFLNHVLANVKKK